MTENNNTPRKINTRKLLYILFSVFVAAAMWLYVDLDNNTKVTIHVNDIPVTYQGQDMLESRGLMLLADSDQTVSLTIEATRVNVGLLDRSKIRVIADLSDITATGEQSIMPKVFLPSKPNGYQFSSSEIVLKDSSSYMLTVEIGELYSKQIDVRCKLVGSVAEGYSAEEPILAPGYLEIRGQQEDIGPVAYAQVTLEINDATETVHQVLDVQYFDENGNQLSGDGVHPSADQVEVTLPVNVTKELELKMNFVESPGASKDNVTYTITPAKVTVTGDAAQLADVDSLVLDNFDLLSLRDGIATYVYSIPIPEGCQNLSGVTKATLHIAFQDMQTEVLPAGRILYENAPEGKGIEILTQELNVTLFGTTADLAAVTGEDIVVTADLTDFGDAAGTYTVPARVEVRTSGDVGVSGTYQVRVNISETQQGDMSNDTDSDG